ncbi:MAG: spore cortex biosynthesis protein YabQ [Eubacterium sp.]|jgi:hypothetical protein|nr:spore cortex biosynthesis protein YabQ [Eubacterium sp.]
MYESVAENFGLLSSFAIVGFVLGLIYEVFRILRVFLPHSSLAVGLEDFLFFCFAGLITFAYSMELGTGEFRAIFIFAEIIGASAYFVSFGALISFLINKFANALRRLSRKIWNKILTPAFKFIYKIYIKIFKIIVVLYNYSKRHLKLRLKMLYNKIAQLYRVRSELKNKMDGKRNVIKAKISKKA